MQAKPIIIKTCANYVGTVIMWSTKSIKAVEGVSGKGDNPHFEI